MFFVNDEECGGFLDKSIYKEYYKTVVLMLLKGAMLWHICHVGSAMSWCGVAQTRGMGFILIASQAKPLD
jgi:hypothetical protein